MSDFKSAGGVYSAEVFNFVEVVRRHLKEIFPTIQSETNLPINHPLNIMIDLSARSQNQRLLLFEVKYFRNERKLPGSFYLTMASLKETVDRMLADESPILTLIANVDIDKSTEKTFSKSGIPVIRLGATAEQTKLRLKDAFQNLAISVPELDTEGILPSYTIHGSCFVTFPHLQNQLHVYNYAIKPAVRSSGYHLTAATDIQEADYISESIVREIQHADIVIADITGNNPNVFFELGLAYASGKNVILISEDPKYANIIANMKVHLYKNTPEGIDMLRNVLLENLVAFKNKLRI